MLTEKMSTVKISRRLTSTGWYRKNLVLTVSDKDRGSAR